MWYKIPGNDKAITAEVPTAEFDTRLAVFEGDCGQERVCIRSHSDTGYRRNQSTITFLTESETNYFVLLTSNTDGEMEVGSYTFEATVSIAVDGGD